jgi:hypothetical protein
MGECWQPAAPVENEQVKAREREEERLDWGAGTCRECRLAGDRRDVHLPAAAFTYI